MPSLPGGVVNILVSFEANYLGFSRATIRVYIDDPFVRTIKKELEMRGFVVLEVPDIILKGDVEFSW